MRRTAKKTNSRWAKLGWKINSWLPVFYQFPKRSAKKRRTKKTHELVFTFSNSGIKRRRAKHIYVVPFSARLNFIVTHHPIGVSKKTRSLIKRVSISLPFLRKQLIIERGAPSKVSRSKELIVPLKAGSFATAGLLVFGIIGTWYFGQHAVNAHMPTAAFSFVSPEVPEYIKAQRGGLAPSEPISLRIPSASINTKLLTLSRRSDGTIEVPANFDMAGWYKYAPTPGEIGPAVIVGHVDSYTGPAIFYRLRELIIGDEIEVDRADGKTVKFKVTAVKQFSQDNFPTAEVYGNIDHAGLRLITCGGQFNLSILRYSHNTVVYASLIE